MVGRTERAPAFQLYPADALADAAGMTDVEFSWYWRLAFHAWRDRGIPTDSARIAVLLGVTPAKLAKAWAVVGARFVEQGGRLVLPWQEEQREEQAANRVKKQNAANARWQRDGRPDTPPDDANGHAGADADAMQVHMQVECSTTTTASAVPPRTASTTSESVPRAEAPSPAAPAPAISLAAAQREPQQPPRRRRPLVPRPVPPGVLELLTTHYGWDGTAQLTDRQREVRRQLAETLTGQGARLQGEEYVHAADAKHLSDVCAFLAREPLTEPDGAIRIALVRLRESVVEVRAQRAADLRAEDEQAGRSRIERGAAWALEHPEAAARVQRRVEAELGPRATTTEMGRMALAEALKVALADEAEKPVPPPVAAPAAEDLAEVGT